MLLIINILLSVFFITTNENNRIYLLALLLLSWPNWISIKLGVGFDFNLTAFRVLLILYLFINFKKIFHYFLKSPLVYYAFFIIIMLLLDFSLWNLKRFFSERYLISFLVAPIIANKLLIQSNYNSFIKGIAHGSILLLLMSLFEITFSKPMETFDFFSNLIVDNSETYNTLKDELMTRLGFFRPTAGYWNNIALGLAFVSFAPFLIQHKYFGRFTNYILIFMNGLTFSRTAILGLLVIFIINFKKISFQTKIISVILLVYFAIYFIEDSISTGYVDQSLFSVQSRLYYLYLLFDNYNFSSLIFGLGIGEFYRLIFLDIAQHLPSDNSIAMLIFSEGFIGSILLLIPFFKTLRMTYKFKDFPAFSFIFVTLLLIFISNSVVQDSKLFLLSIILILYLNLKYGKHNNLHSRI